MISVAPEPVRRAAALAVAAVTLFGCGVMPSALPQWVADRQPLTACGEEVVERGDTDVEARQCLLDAFRAGEGAELITTQSSGLDGQVTRYLRVHENGTIEIFTDATQDPTGSGTWERETCGQMLGADEVRDVWVEEVFVMLDCNRQPIP
ncbi:MAG TPA: hypothetical protein VEW95_08800 [Candidatus Limnocylindrales bacterium]|nr:hypothetical protein [Candidatus Limnocylindrales bacterium]